MALGLALVFTLVAVNWALGLRLDLFYDLSFITVCLVLAVRVHRDEFAVAVVLPPALMVTVLLLLGFVAPEMIADEDDGAVQAIVTGIATHSLALVVGWALALCTLELRRRGALGDE